jgi:serine/threonine protein kinase
MPCVLGLCVLVLVLQDVSEDLKELLLQLLRKEPEDRISLEDALDHPWVQLADEDSLEGDLSTTQGFPPQSHSLSLRARAMSYHQIVVTDEEISGAIRTVNNFVLVVCPCPAPSVWSSLAPARSRGWRRGGRRS